MNKNAAIINDIKLNGTKCCNQPVWHKRGNTLARAAALALLAGCLLVSGQARADDDGTDQATENTTTVHSNTGPFGYLEVFSSTQQTQWGEGSFYYLHTGYRIFDAKGKTVKWVENHDSVTDEQPQKVELAPGKYTIWAQSDQRGYVKMSVSIGLARTTTVQLENDRDDNMGKDLLARK